MNDLFTEEPTPAAEPTDLARLVTVFLNRWHWRGERAIVRAELLDLLTQAQHDGMAETCRNCGCQEIR